MASTNTWLSELAFAMAEKLDKFDAIAQEVEDRWVTGLTPDMANADLELTDAQTNQNKYIEQSSSPVFTANRTLTVQARKHLWLLSSDNQAQYYVIFKVKGGGETWVFYAQGGLFYVTGSAIQRLPYIGGWQDVAATVGFANGNWSNVGSPWYNVQFVSYPTGEVGLHGAGVNAVDSPPVNVFTLPSALAPSKDFEFLCPASAGTAVIRVASTGIVSVQSGTISTRVNLDGIVYTP